MILKFKNVVNNIVINEIKSQHVIDTLKEIDTFDANNNIIRSFQEYDPNFESLIEIKNLKKSFIQSGKKNVVVKSVSFDIKRGENIALLGSNGAGKTTIVEMIAGVSKQDSGEINFKFKYKVSPLEQLGIQFQDSTYPPGLLVKQIIDFMIGIYSIKISKSELNAIIKIFSVEKFYHKRASSLSGGQLQRLNALLAILHHPKVLFLDELSTGLDPAVKNRIKHFIKNYAKENDMTIILVSHDISEIELLADRIIVLFKGEIVVNETKKRILEKHKNINAFLEPYLV
ncbi:MAG: ABC transporter ATP-binding protein [Mycoplasmoidaceae bacterium]